MGISRPKPTGDTPELPINIKGSTAKIMVTLYKLANDITDLDITDPVLRQCTVLDALAAKANIELKEAGTIQLGQNNLDIDTILQKISASGGAAKQKETASHAQQIRNQDLDPLKNSVAQLETNTEELTKRLDNMHESELQTVQALLQDYMADKSKRSQVLASLKKLLPNIETFIDAVRKLRLSQSNLLMTQSQVFERAVRLLPPEDRATVPRRMETERQATPQPKTSST